MGSARPVSTDGTKPRRTTTGHVEVAVLTNGVDQLAQNNGGTSMNAAPSTEGGVTGTTAAPAQNQQKSTGSSNNAQQPASNQNASVPK
jgi:hypothetical protein